MNAASRINRAERRRGYAHFDSPVTYYEVRRLVENPNWVSHHAFLPLIYREIDRSVYKDANDGSGEKGVIPKSREIVYASHLDHRIYQYYALKWGDLYECKLREGRLENSVVAYRKGVNRGSIESARAAISAMRKLDCCTVLTADFKDFFPSLDHRHLKSSMRNLFDGGSLPQDDYQVLKSVLHYAYWPLEDLLRLRGFDVSSPRALEKALKKVNKTKQPIISHDVFATHKGQKICAPWKAQGNACHGIPQGLAVSGVLSNIYMLEADVKIQELVERVGGYYSRYCDDFIIVIPGADNSVLNEIVDFVKRYPRVEISSEKTRIFHVANKAVTPVHMDGSVDETLPCHISYLGFDFDEAQVTLRQKTTGRFFSRYYRAVRTIRSRRGLPTNRQVKRLYRTYSDVGAYMGKPYGKRNFLSYVKRAQKAFPDDPISAPFKHMYKKIKRGIC